MRKVSVILFFLILSISILANGGPIIRNTPVIGTGNPVFRNIKDIKLISEKLYIRLDESYSYITVKYILLNESDKDYNNIDYAFPIDYFLEEHLEKPPGWRESFVKDVRFFQDGRPLSTESADSDSEQDSLKAKYEFLKENRGYFIWPMGDQIMRKWYYTTLAIKKNSGIELEVTYSLKNRSVSESPLEGYLSDGGHYYTSYDFMPASYWGDGIIRDFYVEVDASSLLRTGNLDENFRMKDHRPIDNYQPLSLSGLEFKQKSNQIYTYSEKNFDLKNSIPLLIDYGSTNSLRTLTTQRIANDEYTLTVSGEQAKYPKSNLTDMNLETAWVAKKVVGESIEITFKKKYFMMGFCLVNGYWKNEQTFYNNNRIKKIKVEVQEEAYEYDDNNGVHHNYPRDKKEHIVELPDEKYQELNFTNLFTKNYGYNFGWEPENEEKIQTEGKVEKIIITILEVYPGRKYNDTCISELIFIKEDESGEYYY